MENTWIFDYRFFQKCLAQLNSELSIKFKTQWVSFHGFTENLGHFPFCCFCSTLWFIFAMYLSFGALSQLWQEKKKNNSFIQLAMWFLLCHLLGSVKPFLVEKLMLKYFLWRSIKLHLWILWVGGINQISTTCCYTVVFYKQGTIFFSLVKMSLPAF